MRVRLLVTPDIGRGHGIRKGRVFQVERERPAKGHLSRGYWVRGDRGHPVLVLAHEVVVMPDGWG